MYIKKTITEMELDSIIRSETENLSCEYVNNNHYVVHNLDKCTCYDVTIDTNGNYECSCPHHTYRRVKCKHIIKIQNYI